MGNPGLKRISESGGYFKEVRDKRPVRVQIDRLQADSETVWSSRIALEARVDDFNLVVLRISIHNNDLLFLRI